MYSFRSISFSVTLFGVKQASFTKSSVSGMSPGSSQPLDTTLLGTMSASLWRLSPWVSPDSGNSWSGAPPQWFTAILLMFLYKNQWAVMCGCGKREGNEETPAGKAPQGEMAPVHWLWQMHQNGGVHDPLWKDIGNQVKRMKSKASLWWRTYRGLWGHWQTSRIF